MRHNRRLLIFTGDGKGKTTAALGMVLRAAGHGQRVMVIQFVKADSKTGELAACQRLPGVEIAQLGCGFIPPRKNPKFAEHHNAALHALDAAVEAVTSDQYDLIVLDEICVAVAHELIPEDKVLDLIHRAPKKLCLVLTGRGASQRLIHEADTVTEMKCVKHAMQASVPAQTGVEF
ncbi:MAG: cob(I)yrinic acid a,c-diamide adenosyltransferase [Verrucomicrobia bacterium]|nr:cob(I)yrinic acid a,c-diamide adenosyltransferase [Verrucomicrobiota bacterium]